MPKGTKQIKIALDLYEKLQEKAVHAKFKSADAYVEYILSQILQTEDEDKITQEEEEAIKERLRSLGYL